MTIVRNGFGTLLIAGLLTACGGGSTNGSTAADATGDQANSAALPAECLQPPLTVTAERDGEHPAGSTTYAVASTVGLPIPLVPDKRRALADDELISKGATTDLLGFVLFFGDEQFGPDDVSMFGGYAPATVGHSRGTVSIFPHTSTPLAAGDVILPGPLDGLDMTTTLLRVTMDFKAAPDELTSYMGTIEGSVRIVALDDTSICLDVDLRWPYSDFSADALGSLTVKGIFTATLTPRTMPFT